MIDEEVMTKDQRFGLHDSKPRGTTDMKGRQAKQETTGWKEESMVDICDFEVSVVKPVND